MKSGVWIFAFKNPISAHDTVKLIDKHFTFCTYGTQPLMPNDVWYAWINDYIPRKAQVLDLYCKGSLENQHVCTNSLLNPDLGGFCNTTYAWVFQDKIHIHLDYNPPSLSRWDVVLWRQYPLG